MVSCLPPYPYRLDSEVPKTALYGFFPIQEVWLLYKTMGVQKVSFERPYLTGCIPIKKEKLSCSAFVEVPLGNETLQP